MIIFCAGANIGKNCGQTGRKKRFAEKMKNNHNIEGMCGLD